MLLPFAPPSGAVTVERVDAAGEVDKENVGFCCRRIVPAARETPTLDRRKGRRKAEENSLDAGNEVLESDAVLRLVGGRMELIYVKLVEAGAKERFERRRK